MYPVDKEFSVWDAAPPLYEAELFGDCNGECYSAAFEPFAFREGTEVFRRGGSPARVWILTSGRGVLNGTAEGKPGRRVEPGEIVGLTESLADMPYMSTFRTSSACEGRSIGREEFEIWLQARPQLALKVLNVLSRNYLSTFRRLADEGL